MEHNNEELRTGPLPGGNRQGTSGADAGCHSLRTVSGSLLNSRARVGGPEGTTAGHICANEALQSRLSPTSSVGSSETTTTTSSIINDARRKWSLQELHELMFCYYKAKKEGVGYINRLFTFFKERNPTNTKILKFTGNTLSNQVRTILKRKTISDEVLNEIRHRAERTDQADTITPLGLEQNTQNNTNNPTHNTYLQPEQNTHNNTNNPTHNTNLEPEQNTHNFNTLINVENENTSSAIDDDTLHEPIQEIDSNLDVNEDQDPLITRLLQIISEMKEIPIEDRQILPKPTFNKQFYQNLNTINKFLPTLLATQHTIRELNDTIYAAAKALIITNGQKPYTPSNVVKRDRDPPWKMRLKNKIEGLRKDLGRLTEIKRGINTNKMFKLKRKLYNKYNIFNEQDHDNIMETVKQRIKAIAGRLKRYDDINDRKIQNKLFKENQHKFYRKIENKQQVANEIPSKETIEDFWKAILSQPITYNKEAQWIKDIETTMNEVQEHSFRNIDTEKIVCAVKKTHNWKTPGIDKIQNYYLKYLTSTHKYIAIAFNRILDGIESIDEWFITGQVILIPKDSNTQDPKNWRPIACLPTMYKLLTSVLANVLYTHCDNNNIMAPEQRGCRRGARGCKDHLMINKAILEDAHVAQKNLSMGWIDYRKAFDSVSHEWLLKILDMYKCPAVVSNFLRQVMPRWKVIMTANGKDGSVTTEPILVRRGIFQGDSLSPLLFCLAINPLSQILNKYETKGYKLKDSSWVNHLLYMDDLKVYANNKNNLQVLIDSTEIFTKDVGMNFGLNKCNVMHLVGGRRNECQGQGHILLSGEEFEILRENQKYKYLGIHESGKIVHKELREAITKEYYRRVKCLANSHLNAVNMITGINTYAIPVLLYSIGIVNYRTRDLESIDIKTRKILAIYKIHQQKADKERLYIPRKEGGRGMVNIEMTYKTQILKYTQYFKTARDYLVEAIVEHDKNRIKYSMDKEAREIAEEIGLETTQNCTDEEIKRAVCKKNIEKWKAKPLHGQFYKAVMEKANIDKMESFAWLKRKPVSPALESSIFAIQDQAIVTRQHERDIHKKSVDGRCRLCSTRDETIHHITSGCEKLAGTYYTKRHNNIVQYVFWTLLQKHNFETEKLWWNETLTHPHVRENEEAKLLWEMGVQTDKEIRNNRPDIIYINKKENKTYLIDIAVPSDYNIGPKEIEKLTKYHPLKIELNRLWKTKTSIVPIIVGATGVIGNSLHTYCRTLDSHIDINIMQKQAAIHTTTIVSKVLGDSVFVNNIQVTHEPTSETQQASRSIATQQSSIAQHLDTSYIPAPNTLNHSPTRQNTRNTPRRERRTQRRK